jgi:hypothetical protein
MKKPPGIMGGLAVHVPITFWTVIFSSYTRRSPETSF